MKIQHTYTMAFSYPGKETETGERSGTGKYNIEVAHTQKDKNHILFPVQILLWHVYGMTVDVGKAEETKRGWKETLKQGAGQMDT